MQTTPISNGFLTITSDFLVIDLFFARSDMSVFLPLPLHLLRKGWSNDQSLVQKELKYQFEAIQYAESCGFQHFQLWFQIKKGYTSFQA